MTTVTPDQGITLQVGTDPANLPSAQTSQTAPIESRLVLRYASIADRTARHPVGAEGELSHLADVDRYEGYNGAAWISGAHRMFYAEISKSADQTVNNVAVDQADLHMTVPVAANSGTYRVNIPFFYSASTAADLRLRLGIPAGTVGRIVAKGLVAGTAGTSGDWIAASVTAESGTDLVVGGAAVGTALGATLEGEVTIGANAGSLTFMWAQNVADATNTVVYARSLMQVWRIS